MTQDHINQSLKLTIQDLVTKLSDEMTAKNLIALQVVEKDEELNRLRQENQELTTLLDSQTNPEIGGEDHGIIES
ncbi:hypothetical protein K3N29_05070 [Streptococcus dysgalactiae subsp. dysgalactiae]|uniref:hypothetical protein n=1 Tax=Streptococcus dysgalactiae TaxID=1334 RepID=UPI001CF2D916|nr:hypothetical protein [Streptococcus dysgalactiae]MCB2837237.1 hypothetical protein [Streptococcus dysgalactiae subsp. dysgalactiae]